MTSLVRQPDMGAGGPVRTLISDHGGFVFWRRRMQLCQELNFQCNGDIIADIRIFGSSTSHKFHRVGSICNSDIESFSVIIQSTSLCFLNFSFLSLIYYTVRLLPWYICLPSFCYCASDVPGLRNSQGRDSKLTQLASSLHREPSSQLPPHPSGSLLFKEWLFHSFIPGPNQGQVSPLFPAPFLLLLPASLTDSYGTHRAVFPHPLVVCFCPTGCYTSLV